MTVVLDLLQQALSFSVRYLSIYIYVSFVVRELDLVTSIVLYTCCAEFHK